MRACVPANAWAWIKLGKFKQKKKGKSRLEIECLKIFFFFLRYFRYIKYRKSIIRLRLRNSSYDDESNIIFFFTFLLRNFCLISFRFLFFRTCNIQTQQQQQPQELRVVHVTWMMFKIKYHFIICWENLCFPHVLTLRDIKEKKKERECVCNKNKDGDNYRKIIMIF